MREVLVVELLGGLGDVLLVLPAVSGLARTHPEARVRVLTFRPGDELLHHHPDVTEVVATDDHADGAPYAAVVAQLERQRPDLVVSTTRYGGIAQLVDGWPARSVSNLWRQPPPDELVDLRFLRLLVADGLVDPAYADLPPQVVLTDAERAAGAELVGAVDRPVLLLPDAGMRVKRWPDRHWVALAAELRAAGRPVLTAGPPVPDATGLPRTGLRVFAAALAAVGARGGLVVGGDTGPLRLATAVGTPAVGLYGPTLAARYGVRGPGTVNLQGLPGCEVRRPTSITEQRCWWDAHCPLTGGDSACMADLSPYAVTSAVLAG